MRGREGGEEEEAPRQTIEAIKLEPKCMRDRKAFEIYSTEVSYCETLSIGKEIFVVIRI